MPKTLHFIFGDQLSLNLSSLRHFDKNHDVILMCEVMKEATYVLHHPKKIAFIFSAMRHFVLELQGLGYEVDYVKLDDEKNSGSFEGELQRAISRHNPQKIIITEPSEYRVLDKVLKWQELYKI
jgi:deoxyribodipyrimidine photolyase-related protein